MEEPTVPAVLDPSGRDVHGEGAALRARGEAVRVLLPGGVPAWAITRHEVIRALMGDARVSKDACRHWPAWIGLILAILIAIGGYLRYAGDEPTEVNIAKAPSDAPPPAEPPAA